VRLTVHTNINKIYAYTNNTPVFPSQSSVADALRPTRITEQEKRRHRVSIKLVYRNVKTRKPS